MQSSSTGQTLPIAKPETNKRLVNLSSDQVRQVTAMRSQSEVKISKAAFSEVKELLELFAAGHLVFTDFGWEDVSDDNPERTLRLTVKAC